MYKKADQNDAEKMKQKQEEIDEIKNDMEVLKLKRIDEAKGKMEFQKQSIKREKENFFKTFKGSLKLENQTSGEPVSRSPNISGGGLSPMIEKEDNKLRALTNKKSKSYISTDD